MKSTPGGFQWVYQTDCYMEPNSKLCLKQCKDTTKSITKSETTASMSESKTNSKSATQQMNFQLVAYEILMEKELTIWEIIQRDPRWVSL